MVKAILIDGLGFVSRLLYLFSQFFEDKGIEELLGEEIKTDYINDDKIGRVMDELYKHGLNDIFIEVGLSVINKFKIETKYSHLDATSFPLDGEYKSEEKKREIRRRDYQRKTNNYYQRIFSLPSTRFETMRLRLNNNPGWRRTIICESRRWK